MKRNIIFASFIIFSLFLYILQGESIAKNKLDKYPTTSDLPKLKWMNDGLESFRWGMTPSQVQSILGVRLRLFNEHLSLGEEEYTVNAATTWFKQRIIFDTQSFTFVKKRLVTISFHAYSGWEDNLLELIFAKFGPARNVPYRNFHIIGGELINAPIRRNIPRTSKKEVKDYSYQWFGNETDVQAGDWYGWNNKIRKFERGAWVSLNGWKVELKYAVPDRKESIREQAEKLLSWINWWYRNHQ